MKGKDIILSEIEDQYLVQMQSETKATGIMLPVQRK